jgi:hypothetical protein
MDTVATTSTTWFTGTQLLAPLIMSFVVALLTTFLTYYFTRKIRLDAEWRVDKLKHYEQLVSSITHLMSMPDDNQHAYKDFQRIANVISLVAPQDVVNILTEYQEEIQGFWEDDSDEGNRLFKAKQLLRDLVLAIRKDLKIKPKDKPKSFLFYIRSPILFDE